MSQLQVTGEAKIRDIQGPVVANSGVITALDGAASQYVRGDGTLADFPTSSGGGSSVSYYLNSSVSQGTIGGVAYRELSKEPIIGAGTDIAISANGYVANYLTDVNDPDVTIVAGGNFNCEFYFSVNNNSGNPTTYAELYKYDGTTFTLLGSNVGVPESINQGTTIAPYYFAIPVATAALSVTDRLAIRIYVNVSGRTVTLHTENGHLCQVVTTLSKGMVSLNNLTDQSQYLTTGTSGTNFAIASSGDTHTFNLPVASATNTGKLSSTDWSTFNGKVPYTGAIGNVDLGTYSLTATGVTANSFNAIGSGVQGGYIYLKQGTTPYAYLLGSNGISADGTKFLLIANVDASNNKSALFELSSLTNNTSRTYTLPDASGTLALTSNLSSYVPYNGATALLDMGINPIWASSLFLNGTPTTIPGYLFLKKVSNSAYVNYDGYGGITAHLNNFTFISDVDVLNSKRAIFDLASLTNNTNRTFTLPDASGTLALTSNLSAYLPLTGGTLTGALAGTSATFSSSVTATQGNFSLGTVGGAIGSVKNLTVSNSNGDVGDWAGLNFAYYNNTTNFGYIGTIVTSGATNALADMVFGVKANTSATAVTEYMRIKGGGNVGIGTSSPNVNGFSTALTINGSGTSALELTVGGVNQGYLGSNTSNVFLVARTNIPMTFYTNDTERMRITSGGNTLFGGTAFTTIASAVLGATNTAFTGRNWSFGPNSSGDYVVYHNQGGNAGVYLAYGGSSWTSNSDENIKDIIEVIPNALESIKDFRAVKFYWKSDETKKENIGLIAQDVEKSYPQLIDKQIFDDKEILGIRYMELIPVLVKAIQELKLEIDELKNK